MVFINAMSLHKLVQIPLLLEATINITISVLLVKYTPLGIIGVALGTLIGQALISMYYIPRIVARQLRIKPFSEIAKIVMPLFIPVLTLLGLKILIDFSVVVTPVRYLLYSLSLGLYVVLLYSIVLSPAEKGVVKERIPRWAWLRRVIPTQAVPSPSVGDKSSVGYFWEEGLNPDNPTEEGLPYEQETHREKE